MTQSPVFCFCVTCEENDDFTVHVLELPDLHDKSQKANPQDMQYKDTVCLTGSLYHYTLFPK